MDNTHRRFNKKQGRKGSGLGIGLLQEQVVCIDSMVISGSSGFSRVVDEKTAILSKQMAWVFILRAVASPTCNLEQFNLNVGFSFRYVSKEIAVNLNQSVNTATDGIPTVIHEPSLTPPRTGRSLSPPGPHTQARDGQDRTGSAPLSLNHN